MNILIVIHRAWNLHNFRLALIEALLKSGHKVIALVPDKGSLHPGLEGKIECREIFLKNQSLNPLWELRSWFSIFRNILRYRPDIILSYTIKPNIISCFLGKLCGIPVLPNVTGIGQIKHYRPSIRVPILHLYKKVLSHASWVFFQNPDDATLQRQNLSRKKNFSILPGSGVDPEKFKPHSRPVDTPRIRFLLVSRMVYTKGIREFVEAANSLRFRNLGCEFLLVGPTSENNAHCFGKSELEAYLQNSPVHYAGFSKNVREHLQTADCFVLPSYYPEGLPKSLLEAASMELPLITTDTPGCREIVDEGKNGFLVAPRSVESLVDAMQKMIAIGHEKRREFGLFSRKKIIDGFTEQQVVSEYMKKIHDIHNKTTT